MTMMTHYEGEYAKPTNYFTIFFLETANVVSGYWIVKK